MKLEKILTLKRKIKNKKQKENIKNSIKKD